MYKNQYMGALISHGFVCSDVRQCNAHPVYAANKGSCVHSVSAACVSEVVWQKSRWPRRLDTVLRASPSRVLLVIGVNWIFSYWFDCCAMKEIVESLMRVQHANAARCMGSYMGSIYHSRWIRGRCDRFQEIVEAA